MLHTLTACLTLIAAEPLSTSARPVKVPALITLISEVDVPAQEHGVLTRVYVRAGQHIESGTILGELDTTDAELAASRAQAELEIARAEAGNELKIRSAENLHKVAETELQRAVELNRKYPNSVSDTEMDRLQLTRDSAALEIEQAPARSQGSAASRPAQGERARDCPSRTGPSPGPRALFRDRRRSGPERRRMGAARRTRLSNC